MINNRFQQVLQIQKWGVRSAKRAGIGAAGGPSQLGGGIKKGRCLGLISGPGPGGRTPRPMGGCLPVAGPRQMINGRICSNENTCFVAEAVAGPRQRINRFRRPPPLPPWLMVEIGVKQGSRVVVKFIGLIDLNGPDRPTGRSKTPGAKSPLRASLPGLRVHPPEWPLPDVIHGLFRCSFPT